MLTTSYTVTVLTFNQGHNVLMVNTVGVTVFFPCWDISHEYFTITAAVKHLHHYLQ